MILLLQFHSPIVYLLCVAAFVTFLFGDLIESSAIVVVILLNAMIGFSMEMQARKSMEALKSMDKLAYPSEFHIVGNRGDGVGDYDRLVLSDLVQ